MKTNANDGAFANANNDAWQDGLTKREYFAAMAMKGLVANSHITLSETSTCKVAIKLADILINELNKE